MGNEYNLVPIDQWDLENPYIPPPSRLIKSIPRGTLSPGTSTSFLFSYCGRHGIIPVVEFEDANPGYRAFVRINGQLYSEAGPFASKSQAKNEACQLALNRLHDESMVFMAHDADIDNQPVKLGAIESVGNRRNSTTGTEQSSSPSTTERLRTNSHNREARPSKSCIERAEDLCSRLGLAPWRYHLAPVPGLKGFYSGHLTFPPGTASRHPALDGPIGEVYRVYGLGKAKDEAVRRTLPLLEALVR